MLEKLYTEKEMADLMGVSSNMLAHWRSYGQGPKYMKMGRLIRYRREDVEEYFSSIAVTPLHHNLRRKEKESGDPEKS